MAGLVYLALTPGDVKLRHLFSLLDGWAGLCVDDGLETLWNMLDYAYVRKPYGPAMANAAGALGSRWVSSSPRPDGRSGFLRKRAQARRFLTLPMPDDW